MEAIHTTKNTSVQSVAHDEDVLREEVSLFLKLWPKLSAWEPTTMLRAIRSANPTNDPS